jgi:hypothetical protein
MRFFDTLTIKTKIKLIIFFSSFLILFGSASMYFVLKYLENNFNQMEQKETEMELRRKLPKKYWININRFLVAYGQSVCTPTSPWCSKCKIRKYCDRVGVKKSR